MTANGKQAKPQPPPAGSRQVPHNLDAEEALLAAMLQSSSARDEALAALRAEDFYRPNHGHVFAAMAGLHESGEPVDALSVDYELRNMGVADAVGGIAALTGLQVVTLSNAGSYARIVRDLALQRRLIGLAGEIADDAYGHPDDVTAAVLDAAARLEALLPGEGGRAETLGAGLEGWLDALEGRVEHPDRAGVPSCWRALDRFLVGLRPGQLTIVGGRPSAGKSQVLLCWAWQMAAQTGVPALVVSLEMTVEEVQDRVVALAGRIDRSEIRRGQLSEPSWMRLSNAMGKLNDLPLWVEHDPEASVTSVRAAARRVQRTAGRRPVVFVDYAQLMTVPRRAENRQVEMAELSRSLKRAASEWPIVAASQLSRKVEERSEKRPVLSDLRESGGWEADADIVLLVHRPDAHDPADRPGELDLIVAKQRNGPTGTATLLHDRKTGVLRDVPEQDAADQPAMNL